MNSDPSNLLSIIPNSRTSSAKAPTMYAIFLADPSLSLSQTLSLSWVEVRVVCLGASTLLSIALDNLFSEREREREREKLRAFYLFLRCPSW